LRSRERQSEHSNAASRLSGSSFAFAGFVDHFRRVDPGNGQCWQQQACVADHVTGTLKVSSRPYPAWKLIAENPGGYAMAQTQPVNNDPLYRWKGQAVSYKASARAYRRAGMFLQPAL